MYRHNDKRRFIKQRGNPAANDCGSHHGPLGLLQGSRCGGRSLAAQGRAKRRPIYMRHAPDILFLFKNKGAFE